MNELLSRDLIDRLHGDGCSCPIHRPDLYEPEHHAARMIATRPPTGPSPGEVVRSVSYQDMSHENCPGCVNCGRGM